MAHLFGDNDREIQVIVGKGGTESTVGKTMGKPPPTRLLWEIFPMLDWGLMSSFDRGTVQLIVERATTYIPRSRKAAVGARECIILAPVWLGVGAMSG